MIIYILNLLISFKKIYNITKGERAPWLANSASTIMLLTYSITKAKRALCDVAQFVAQRNVSNGQEYIHFLPSPSFYERVAWSRKIRTKSPLFYNVYYISCAKACYMSKTVTQMTQEKRRTESNIYFLRSISVLPD